MANGKVIVGFSHPWVAVYSNSGSSVSYTGGMALARGVSVSIEVSEPESNPFYADDTIAEDVPSTFTGGTVTLTVDGLKEAARRLIYGLPTASSVTVDGQQVAVEDYGAAMEIPYVGIGFLICYMEDGVESWAPVLLTKGKFSPSNTVAATRAGVVEWQTEELKATLSRDDSDARNWKRIAEDQASEAAGEAVLKTLLGVTA